MTILQLYKVITRTDITIVSANNIDQVFDLLPILPNTTIQIMKNCFFKGKPMIFQQFRINPDLLQPIVERELYDE
jgi:hypothetical protein